jgi:hypothetical protein
MKFRISAHARRELDRRSIPEDVANAVLEHPEQVLPGERGRRVYQSRISFPDGKIFLVRVVVEDRPDMSVVITAYRTSKIDKYWRSQ